MSLPMRIFLARVFLCAAMSAHVVSPRESVGLTQVPPRESVGLTQVPPRESVGLTQVPPRESVGLTQVPPRESVGLTQLPPRESVGPAQVPPRESVGPEQVPSRESVGPAQVPPRESVGLAQLPPRESVGPAQVPPRESVGPAQVPPRESVGPAQLPPRESVGPAQVPPRESVGPAQVPPRESVGPAQVPLSAAHRESLEEAVCEGDLGFTGEELRQCKDNFNWDMEWVPSGLEVRCRSNTSVTLQVPPAVTYRLLLLLPHRLDAADTLEYQIVSPRQKYAALAAPPDTPCTLYSAALGGRWRHEGSLRPWAPPPHHTPYHLRVRVSRTEGLITSVVSWNTTGDLDACFNLLVKCSKMFVYESKTLWPDSAIEQQFTDLPANDSCAVYLAGVHGSARYYFDTYLGETEAKSEELEPLEEFKLYSEEEEGGGWRVVVWWQPQHTQPDWYNVTLRAHHAVSLLLPGNATRAEFRRVPGAGLYNVTVYSTLGRQVARYTKRALFTRGGGTGGGRAWRWAGAAAAAWAAAALAAALYCRLRGCTHTFALSNKPKVESAVESKLVESACTEAAHVEPEPDTWEIQVERLLLHEVIGEGAFGVVRRGILAPLGKEVAVKMLKDFPTREELRAFRVEMELLKSVGAHPHVVSLVGCCSGRHPALVAEYCSRGDLLNFLRCSWDVMVSKRNANYYNNNTNSCEYRNEVVKGKQAHEHARLVVNHLYDVQGGGDTDLAPQDLLSFCRQIAMGMEFLALNKVVHRDLAARNILVTADRTLKIADFGLSRDIYEENQYKQKGNGKMPVKWMALESLTRRIYTTQSDVWSFGVVMWEVVTVGAAPYAGVAAARLPRLLRQGYRLPHPPNCTHHLYSLMESCWAARPRERPTFTELHARLDELLRGAAADQYLSLELDDEPPPTPKHNRYFRMIINTARGWSRAESYERPLAAPRNRYTAPPAPPERPLAAPRNHYTAPPHATSSPA